MRAGLMIRNGYGDMQKLRIVGGRRLVGQVKASGAKNAALPIIAAALLTADDVVLHNVPELADVRTMAKLLEGMGVAFEDLGNGTVRMNAGNITSTQAPYELVKTMRASVLVLGPLTTRFGNARVSLPGGCSIGARPVDQHIKALKMMGAEIEIDHGYMQASAGRLKGCRIVPDMVTVTGTENIMMAAVLAEGTTIIENAAREPEVIDLAECLNKMGAKVTGAGTPQIVIEGVEKLHGCEHSVIADRIETGTFLCAALATGGDVMVTDTVPWAMEAVIGKLREAGGEVEVGEDWIRAKISGRPKAVDVRTIPHPGFPTDMQAQIMVLSALADGSSVITENIFENRFMFASELVRMGADIRIESHHAMIHGVKGFSGAQVTSPDLRGGAALVVAGLIADGTTEVSAIHHIKRGYEQFVEKLQALGAHVEHATVPDPVIY